MHSLLANVASFAVVLHMTFGCGWHHGQGAHACESQCSTPGCSHIEPVGSGECCASGHNHADHNQPKPAQNENLFDENGDSPDQRHFCCQADHCNATQIVKFVFLPIDFCLQYLGGAESHALIGSQSRMGFDLDPFPYCSHTASSVRAHLLFGIQII